MKARIPAKCAPEVAAGVGPYSKANGVDSGRPEKDSERLEGRHSAEAVGNPLL